MRGRPLIRSWGVAHADIDILEISPSRTLAALQRQLFFSAGLAFVLFLTYIVAFRRIPPLFIVIIVLAIVPITGLVFVRRVSYAAQRRRTDMNMAVAVFLDLVNVLLAGGAGIETAIVTAASAGDGWAFEEIRNTITRAQSSRERYWDALHDAGSFLQVQSLQDVAQSIRLAGEHGGRIRQSLMSRADALRKSNLAHIEHEAERRTERMGVPMVVMFVGFVMFIGYPAFATTMTAL
jgi:tight adherence protein C